MTSIAHLAMDRRGATAIEYSLLASLIALALIGSTSFFAGAVSGMWTYVITTLAAAMNGS
jgi:Flp pilus assembly pilin Flp